MSVSALYSGREEQCEGCDRSEIVLRLVSQKTNCLRFHGRHFRRVNIKQPVNEELSREALYQQVWSKPLATLAAEFGISDVALAKRCRKLNVPTPRRGFWAKVEAGLTVVKPRLPSMIGGPLPQVPASAHHSRWPRDVLGLCPRAQSLLKDLTQLKPNYEGLQSLERPDFPKVAVTLGVAERTARFFHAILVAVEATGVPLRKARSKYEGAYFEKQNDRLYFEITEIAKTETVPNAWAQKKHGTGKLSITLSSEYYGRGWKKSWKESEDGGVREIVGSVTKSISDYYADRAREKIEAAERRRVEHERWVKEQEVRKKQAHEQALGAVAGVRAEDFLHAVEWAHLHQRSLAFIAECERRWRPEGGPFLPEQEEWLRWARGVAEAWSPWTTGYPDPMRDGGFDPNKVPFGGPYPPTRKFPRPPSLGSKNPPAEQWSATPKESYPFWIRHPANASRG